MKGFHVRREAHWIVISLFLAVAGCGGDSGTNNGGNTGNTGGGGTTPTVTTDVTVGDGGDVFTPPDIQVLPGATVTWTWAAITTHNVTFASSSVSDPSATQATGMFQVTMPTAAAVYNYECTIHPGMDGSVRVLNLDGPDGPYEVSH